MLSLRKINMPLLALLLAACQQISLTDETDGSPTLDETEGFVSVVGTGLGSIRCPYTVTDLCEATLPSDDPVWVIGYVVGTARQAMSNAVFTPDAENQTNILLSPDSLCTSTNGCIPVELQSARARTSFSVPTNREHFRKCLLVKGLPSVYLNRKGLRGVSTGLWLDGFDISSVAPQNWGSIEI